MDAILTIVVTILFLIGLASVSSFVTGQWKLASHRRQFRSIADQLGLDLRFTWGGDVELNGVRDGMSVAVRVQQIGVLEARVSGKGIPKSLRAKSSGWSTKAVPTGDRELDKTISVEGPRPIVAALFDDPTRQLLASVLGKETWIRSGEVVFHRVKDWRYLSWALDNTDRFDRMIELARHLVLEDSDIPRRLAENAVSDKDPDVRLINLRVLAEFYPTDPRCRETQRQSLTSTSAPLRLEAALLLAGSSTSFVDLPVDSPEAKVLMELASNGSNSSEVRKAALEALGRPSWRARVGPLCERLLTRKHRDLHATVLDVLVTTRHRAAIPKLLAALKNADDPFITRLIEALSVLTDDEHLEQVQPHLFELLTHDERDVIRATIEALGQIGDRRAVMPLLEQKGLFGGINDELENAVEKIQHRIEGGESGQLSMALSDPKAGALSRADERKSGGELSRAGLVDTNGQSENQ